MTEKSKENPQQIRIIKYTTSRLQWAATEQTVELNNQECFFLFCVKKVAHINTKYSAISN